MSIEPITPEVAHHFADARQQHEAATLGMWVFLASEIMFFAGLFTGYAFYRGNYPAAFAEGSHHLDIVLGGFNTAVLLTSSLTMALAVQASGGVYPRRPPIGDGLREHATAGVNPAAHHKATIRYLLITCALGGVFLAVKAFEYTHKAHEHLVPGRAFQVESARAEQVELFFSFYFVMTGVHALHLAVGIGVLAVFAHRVWRQPQRHWFRSIETAGLYWHLVDVIWLFLFPLLYLLGRH